MNNRVAITGMGSICGLGHDLKDVWQKVVNGKSGISSIEENSLHEKLLIRVAGEVKNFEIDPDIISPMEQKRYAKFIHFAMHSIQEALFDADLESLKNHYQSHRLGTILGVGMGGIPYVEEQHSLLLDRGPRRVSPFFIPAIIPNMAPGLASIKFGLEGINYSISSACASAGHAISASAFEIISGRQDVIVTGGAESVISDMPMSGFTSMKALSKQVETPQKASRPFDRDRDGFVMGEGAGIIVLENLEKAKARGAKIYAEVVGHGASSDSHHITAPHPEGKGAMNCMKNALESANIKPDQIDYINAHGTSTPLGDIAETKAIKETFKEHAKKLAVSSTKSMTGHLLGAASGIETIFTAMALHDQVLPPTINLENQDPECDLDYVANTARKTNLEYALNNSFGFGGTNSSLILKRYNN